MKYLALVSLLCALPLLSNAYCYRIEGRPEFTHCQDTVDKTWHAVGSRWKNSMCENCDCGGCCQGAFTPVGFPGDCVAVFDPESCDYTVHKRNDPSVLCNIGGHVGK